MRARTSPRQYGSIAAVRVRTHEPIPTATNDAQAAKWSTDRRVKVITRQLNYQGWPDQSPQEKGIDVAVAVDLIQLAFRKEYDPLVLFPGDTDLLPALETTRDLRLGHAELANWHKAKRLRLPGTNFPYCHFLTRQDLDDVTEDWKGRA